MDLIRYNRPRSVFDDLLRDVNGLSNFFDGGSLNPALANPARSVSADWNPAVDIQEESECYLVTADVPGVDTKDIDITFENGVLAISGERKSESSEEADGYKRVERSYGRFQRSFSLPENVDVDRIAAKGKNGVLEITLPKKESVKPKKITVS